MKRQLKVKGRLRKRANRVSPDQVDTSEVTSEDEEDSDDDGEVVDDDEMEVCWRVWIM